MSQRFTAPVRRGFRMLLDQKLAENVEQLITKATAPGKPRAERMTAAEATDLRAAVAWITQEAAEDLEEAPDQVEADPHAHRVDGIAVDPLCDYCGERHEGVCEDDEPQPAGKLF
jgi:hypothetical protein